MTPSTPDGGRAKDAPATDSHGRRVNYLRLSVTDDCNLRCRYCVPPGGWSQTPCRIEPLGFEELLRIARCATELGIAKIRLTGGEPLVRPGLLGFLEELSALPGLCELVLTTNGILLKKMARDLRAAGVARLNVSLDSLDPGRFREITGGGSLARVMAGLEAASAAGFPAPKINVVMMRGVNDHEALDFAELTIDTPYVVRFIEYMPTVGEANWQTSFISGKEILDRIRTRHRLEPIVTAASAGPARMYEIPGAQGALGVVTAVSEHFCASCNRIRVTADGRAKGCLFGMGTTDLAPLAVAGREGALREALRRIIWDKPLGHSLGSDSSQTPRVAMYQVGG